MQKFILTLSMVLLVGATSTRAQKNHGIIPAPLSIKPAGGEFLIGKGTAILYETDEDRKIAELFHAFLKENYSLDLPLAKNFVQAPESVIRFAADNYKGPAEGYRLSVSPKQIAVSGRGAGLFYGMQSLMQLLPLGKQATLSIAGVEIDDAPRYNYRGLHLDVGRHMFPVSFLKKYIDLLSHYKLNTFHWHLTEDQGWRIEIKKYPKLTEVGGYRAQTLIGYYHDRMPQWFDNTPYGGFYTQEEVKEVVAYAREKFVTVIPEIELPGHAVAALAAYPELACGDNPGPFKVEEKWGVFPDIFCAGKENTFRVLQDVLTEVIELFPSTYIHIGGDEAPKDRWEKCKYCQKRIRDNKLKDEHELQSYFIQRIEKFLNAKGRRIIGWDEILEGGLAPNATVMSWRGTKGGIAAAKQNHDVIMTPSPFLYFDYAEGNTLQEPVTIGGYIPLQRAYSYDPTPSELPEAQKKHILGVQANMWTEYMPTPEKVQYMLLPRLFALSEIAWTPLSRKDFTDFAEERVPVHLARLEKASTHFRVPTAIGVADSTYVGDEFTFALREPVRGATIYYTINGYTPRETDSRYDKPIKISVPKGERRVLKTIVITPSGKRSAVTTTWLSNEEPLAAVKPASTRAGLRYYFLPGEFNLASSLDIAAATEKGVATTISLSTFRNKGRAYGLVYEGYIQIPADGVYTFTTASDDGSQLLIDDKLVVDNDGRHAIATLSSSIRLLKGFHKLQVRYFHGGGAPALNVSMAREGQEAKPLAAGTLFH